MLESTFLLLGVMAFIWTVLTLAVAMYVPTTDSTADAVAMVAGVVGFVLWGVWAYAALNIVVIGDAVAYEFSHPELTILGVAMSLIPGYVALTGPIDLVQRYRNATPEDL